MIVADEFLARAASPNVSLPARRRMKKRQTGFLSGEVPPPGQGKDDPQSAESATPRVELGQLQIHDASKDDPPSATSTDFDSQTSAVERRPSNTLYDRRPSASSDGFRDLNSGRRPSSSSEPAYQLPAFPPSDRTHGGGLESPYIPARRPSLPAHIQHADQDAYSSDGDSSSGAIFGSTGRKARHERFSSFGGLPSIPASPSFQPEPLPPPSWGNRRPSEEYIPQYPPRLQSSSSDPNMSVNHDGSRSSEKLSRSRRQSREHGSATPPQRGISQLLDSVLTEVESYLEDLTGPNNK